MKRTFGLIVFLLSVAVAVSALAGTAAAARAAAMPSVTILVKSDDQHAKKGPDGKWHDAFLPANPVLKAGVRTRITLVNYDGSAHSMVAPGIGLNVVVPAAKGSTPGQISFTIRIAKPGNYDWWCTSPCDPWAMTHDGYMRGHFTVGK
jgi:plastocyanin